MKEEKYIEIFQRSKDYRTHLKLLSSEDIEYFKKKFQTDNTQIAIKCAYYLYFYNFIVNTKCPECNKPLQIQKISRQFVRKVSPGFCQLKCSNKSEISRNKIKNTLIEKYNVENCSQLDQVKEKKKETFNQNFSEQQKKELYNKIKKSYFNKTGYKHPMHNPEVRDLMIKNHKKSRYLDVSIIEDLKLFLGKDEVQMEDFDLIKEKSGISTSHLYKLIKQQGLKLSDKFNSRGELEIFNFISTNFPNYEIVVNSYQIIDSNQIDIYIPELKLAIEFNGEYWHSLEHKSENYHLNKTNLCESKGIRLLHIWESKWTWSNSFIKTLLTLYLENKVPQNEFQELLKLFGNRLPRDYFSTLDFPGCEIEEPILERIGELGLYKTGYILMR